MRDSNPWRLLLAGLSLLTLLLSSGCVANRARRDADSRPWPHEPTVPFVSGEQLPQYEPAKGAGSNHNYDLSFIEFDEQGDYWDRRQLGWTAQAIRRATEASNVVLVIYVHGWQNDTGTTRGHDVQKFQCLLDRLSKAQGKGRRYFGVYIGWRGKSIVGGDGWFKRNSVGDYLARGALFLPHELSLFDRQRAAVRVAGMPVTEAIFATVKTSRMAAKKHGHLTKSILIGHSFGALVVEKALNQAVAAEMIVNEKENGVVPTPADFVVLLNSAAPSIYAKEMLDMFRRRHVRAPRGAPYAIGPDHPLIVSVTSKADSATGTLFPIGVGLGNLGAITRRYDWDTQYGASSHGVDQRRYLNTTPGHNSLLASHCAKPEGTPSLPILSDDTGECDDSGSLAGVSRNLLEQDLTTSDGKVRFVTVNGQGNSCYWTLCPVDPHLQTPYWIVQVPKEIMREHSDIFNENSLSLLARLFRLSNPNGGPGIAMPAAPSTMQLDPL